VTKACRHCGEAILVNARVCKHCTSNQTWFAGQKDPRFQAIVFALVLPILAVMFLALRDVKTKLDRSLTEGSCRGLVVLKSSVHALRKIDQRDRLFIRVQIENRSKTDVSEPTIQVEALDATDTVIDAFQRTIYGVNIAPGKAPWFRIDGDLTAEVESVADVHIELTGSVCKSTWN
jgi:hypothetical protein